MAEFVLEIGTEEMPARFLPKLEQDLAQGLEITLRDAHIDFNGIETFSTPRRFVVRAQGVALAQEETEAVVSGPSISVAYDASGNPTKAALGFAKGQGMDASALFRLQTDKGEYVALRKKSGSEQTVSLLPAMCQNLVSSLAFPKRMRWGDRDFSFGRPIRWLLALLDETSLDFEVGRIRSGRETLGHRVLGFGPWPVASASELFGVLRDKAKVVLDSKERKKTIVDRGNALAAAVGGKVVWSESLLGEVTGLVESPKPILANFDPAFLEVPREVLLTSMQSHQKSFGIEDADGNLLPHFLSTLNLESKDEALVRKGWERVLKARLEDARFFWRTDLSRELDRWLDTLDNVVFLGPLGSMGDKSRRMEALCSWLAEQVEKPELAKVSARAGRLAKADLVSDMVGEFAELQGMMGGIYAGRKGEGDDVARAVYEHYLPLGPDSGAPETLVGALVSIADKADTLAGCFGLNMIPTGTADPYALRRNTLGICRIIQEHGLRLDVDALFAKARELYGEIKWKLAPDEYSQKIHAFFVQRLKHYFVSQGFETLLADAVVGAGISDVRALRARLEALAEFSRADDFGQAVLTFKRAANIIRKQGGEAGQPLDGSYRQELLCEEPERVLASKLEVIAPRFDALWAEDKYPELLSLLRELRPSVDNFFDNVMVMCDDPALRLNRLNLLEALVTRLGRIADFNALQI